MSEASFVRAIDASGIGLTKEELGLVINRYRVPGGGGAIDYQRFCDQSNKVCCIVMVAADLQNAFFSLITLKRSRCHRCCV